MAGHSEEAYIAKRKRKAFRDSLAYYLCRVFPIKRNKIVMWTFEGSRGYCCNPKYIADELLKSNAAGETDYEIVWLTEDESSEFPNGIRKVKDTLWSRAYHLSTAKVWVSNTRTFYGTRKRIGQSYIQAWHCTLFLKPIGLFRGDLFPRIARIVSEADSDLADYVLSGSTWYDERVPKGLLYEGEILKTGTPRCDILVTKQERIRQTIRNQYDVPEQAKILLYCPTFRGGSQSTNRSVSAENTSLDLDKLLAAMKDKFGGEWYIFLRLHPQLAAKNMVYGGKSWSDKFVDVTKHQDMNELIAAADCFVTDYSSAIFEAMLLKIPCFIYADDLETYIKDRGDLMFNMEELPFPMAADNEELLWNITVLDMNEYQTVLDRFIRAQGITEDGQASRRTAKLIHRLCEK